MMTTSMAVVNPMGLVGHCGVLNRVRRSSSRSRQNMSFCVRAGESDSIINRLTVAVQNSPLAKGKQALAKLQAGNYDEVATREKLEGLIRDNPVVMFSFSSCPFCKKAKKELDDMGVKYTALELDQISDGMALRAELAEKTGRTSMPNIWIGGEGIGGCNDGPGLMPLKAQGKLEEMLKQADAL